MKLLLRAVPRKPAGKRARGNSMAWGSLMLEVKGEPGKGNWPLRTISRGTICCVWDGGPIVLFEAPDGKQYVINTEALSKRSYTPLGWIMDDATKRSQGAVQVTAKWLKAGIALCDGEVAKAQTLVDEANQLASEEP